MRPDNAPNSRGRVSMFRHFPTGNDAEGWRLFSHGNINQEIRPIISWQIQRKVLSVWILLARWPAGRESLGSVFLQSKLGVY